MRLAKYRSLIEIILLVFAILYLSGCVNTKQKMLDAGFEPLTSQELQSLLSEGKAAKFHNIFKQYWATVKFRPDGTLSAVSGGKNYAGSYFIKNNQYCSKMDFRGGELRCTTWFRDGDTYQLFNDQGTIEGKLTFQ